MYLIHQRKELGPRTAKLTLSICLKMKMIEKVLKSGKCNSENESLLIFHTLPRCFQTINLIIIIT